MPSYLRNIFSRSSATPTTTPERPEDQHKSRRSRFHKTYTSPARPDDFFTPPSNYNAYSTSSHLSLSGVAAAPSLGGAGTEGRDGYNTSASAPVTASPLRCPVYSSESVRSRYSLMTRHPPAAPHPGPATPQQSHPYKQFRSTRVPIYRSSGGDDAGETTPYPVYSSSVNSIHTMSSVFRPGSSSGHRPPMPPRAGSYGSVAPSEPKPALKMSSQPGSINSTQSSARHHVSFMLPRRRTTLHMHPLLAYSRLHRPPVYYDVTYPPSPKTVVDRNTHSPIPSFTLCQPATEPGLFKRLILKHPKLPWPITVSPASAKQRARKFFLAGGDEDEDKGSGSDGKHPVAITNFDVLHAIHGALVTRVTQQEWDALGRGSRAQKKVTLAYEKRCTKMMGGWEEGVKRIDYLGEKTRLVGIEIEKVAEGEIGRLVFGA